MTVIANDFVPVQPYTTEVVTLGVGQRTDILVKATGSPTESVWMRSNISAACSLNDGNPHALAAIFYENANTTLTPKSTAWPYVEQGCANVSNPSVRCYFYHSVLNIVYRILLAQRNHY